MVYGLETEILLLISALERADLALKTRLFRALPAGMKGAIQERESQVKLVMIGGGVSYLYLLLWMYLKHV